MRTSRKITECIKNNILMIYLMVSFFLSVNSNSGVAFNSDSARYFQMRPSTRNDARPPTTTVDDGGRGMGNENKTHFFFKFLLPEKYATTSSSVVGRACVARRACRTAHKRPTDGPRRSAVTAAGMRRSAESSPERLRTDARVLPRLAIPGSAAAAP